ncbi:MAG: nucleotidyltransferase family protein [candidate division Zixibacteria bacterium]|nr:nucleotidyltransferase family protein [candidate division Zixibacteria bacterium]
MLTQERVIELLRKEFPHLTSRYGVKRMGLFGSFAKGIQKEDSDIDIVIEFEKPIGLKFIELAEYIEKLLGRKVDILTSEGIKGIRVKKVGRDIERSIIYV